MSLLDHRPRRIIVIDSGSIDDTLRICLEHGCEIYQYEGNSFNYSRALNQGFSRVGEPYCLVISSHIRILRSDVVSAMLTEMEKFSAVVAWVNYTKASFSVRAHDLADFNGTNGIWNPCALYVSSYVHQLGFDESLPASEDAHFALRLFQLGHQTVELCGPWIEYANPRISGRKRNNGLVAVAYYVYPKNLGIRNIRRVARRAFRRLLSGHISEFNREAALAARLFMARYFEPRFPSRYFKE